VLAGVNTTSADAAAFAEFARGLTVLVNLIPWNDAGTVLFDDAPLRAPSATEVKRFADALAERGLKTVVRRSKGGVALAACGQLGVVPHA
jgi:23S rRNA (adenine2503-C2)-methyltransferase